MRRASPWVAGLAIVMGSTAVAGQDLPPDIQVDLYLVRAERLIENQDYTAALEALDVVLALQARHGLDTPTDLWFRHGQVALEAGFPKRPLRRRPATCRRRADRGLTTRRPSRCLTKHRHWQQGERGPRQPLRSLPPNRSNLACPNVRQVTASPWSPCSG